MKAGDRVRIKKDDVTYTGLMMPPTGEYIVLKLDNGYNVGIKKGTKITVLKKGTKIARRKKASAPPGNRALPKVSILSTGGTIASKVDYRTGAVTSQFSVEDILSAIPELTEIANFDGRVVYSILSENMKAEYWQELARAVADEVKKGADGVMITHGTDTMTYTAAALSFMLKTPVPIVLVGSQRSADRPSSDNVVNTVCAARVATSDIAEVTVVMHATSSDDQCLIHRGTRVRKMHTSKRDAFQSINAKPIGLVNYKDKVIYPFQHAPYQKRNVQELVLEEGLETKCALVKFFPGASPMIVDHYADAGYRGMVIEGTGLGHVSTEWIPSIRRAVDNGMHVIMTSQCLSGRVCDRVYDTGRDLLKAGIIEGEDMLPEVALVKLMWVLDKTNDQGEVRQLMQTSLAGEISERSTYG
ncbi:MAG: Glu-tRNA(Gln) amidotransferase subunit GatD [Methanosarcinales archaeon Met12]|nr:MAG: Glu-tRNA(Gln) amidotransferase subunit GatD [Methanosarcinales archaeon Met12]